MSCLPSFWGSLVVRQGRASFEGLIYKKTRKTVDQVLYKQSYYRAIVAAC
jgi:hypothetical protein